MMLMQTTLFEEKIAVNEIWDAHTLIKNEFNRHLDNPDIFKKYFDFACMIASWKIELNTRNYFLEEANTALAVFAENTVLDGERLEYIKSCRIHISELRDDVASVRTLMANKLEKETAMANHAVLRELAELKGKLFRADKQETFDEVLVAVGRAENSLVKEALSADQKTLYDKMTKEYSALISEKMTELAKLSNVEYNRNAVIQFKYVMDEFRTNESKYADSHSQLFALVSSRLFAYDPSRLYNETLIYYNHVYSYIFSKLDEDGKFRLTQISIDTEKIKS